MILFVDDDQQVTEMLVQALRRWGYSTVAINDPIAALAVFSQAPDRFDAAILDQIMPAMRGTELARQLIRIKDDLPVILLTGYGHLVPADEARESGVRVALAKPFERQELKAVLERLVTKKGPTEFGTR